MIDVNVAGTAVAKHGAIKRDTVHSSRCEPYNLCEK